MKKSNQLPNQSPNHSPRYIQYFAGFFLMAAAFAVGACGNKSENNVQPTQPVYGYQQCLNCQNINGSVFFTGNSTDYTGSLNITWAFTGQNMQLAQPNPYMTGTTPGTYYGQVSTTGQMILSQNINLGYCIIPAGTYSLVTSQAGQMSYGIVSNLAMQAVGPTNMMISFFGQISSPNYSSSVGRMFGNLQIQSVNGQTCQQIIGVQ